MFYPVPQRRRPHRVRVAPDGFKYVQATPEEWAERVAKGYAKGGRTKRLACLACGQRIWGSGLGCASHRRACKGAEADSPTRNNSPHPGVTSSGRESAP